MTHPDRVEHYPGTLAELASELGNLKYDALAAFLHALAAKLSADAAADRGRGRPKLAAALSTAATKTGAAAAAVDQAWAISAPHMPPAE